MWETVSRYSLIPVSAHILFPSRMGTAPKQTGCLVTITVALPVPSRRIRVRLGCVSLSVPSGELRMDPQPPLPATGEVPPNIFGGKEERPGLCPAPAQSSAPALPWDSAGSGCHQPKPSCACPHPSNLQGMGGPNSLLSSLTHGAVGYLRPMRPSSRNPSKGGVIPPAHTSSGHCKRGSCPSLRRHSPGRLPPAGCLQAEATLVGFQRGRHAPRRGSPNTQSWARRGLPSWEWPHSLPLPGREGRKILTASFSSISSPGAEQQDGPVA